VTTKRRSPELDITDPHIREAVAAVRRSLTDDLRKPFWQRFGANNPMAGHCYVASEALYHLLEGSHEVKPMVIRLGLDDTHWFLMVDGEIVDPTRDQFASTYEVPYGEARGCGFLTRQPSKRAATVIDRALEVLV